MQRVVVVSDHALLVALLSDALSREADLEVVQVDECSSQPDVVVVGMADGQRLAAAAEESRRRWPGVAVVMIDDRTAELSHVLAAVRGSTAGLDVLSASAVASARDRLRSVVPRSAAEAYPQLTEREREVLHGLSTGAGPAAIAGALGISVNTCRGYLRTLMAKLGARSQREVLAFVAKHGLPDRKS